MLATEIPAVLTVAECARHLRIGRNQAYLAVKSGVIRSVRIGNSIRIPRSAVEALLGETETAPATYNASAVSNP